MGWKAKSEDAKKKRFYTECSEDAEDTEKKESRIRGLAMEQI